MPIRVYADTSVYGGLYDIEFATASQLFFSQVKKGQFTLFTSALVADEVAQAPEGVREAFYSLLPFAELVPVTGEALRLQRAYLEAGVVTHRWQGDALHVAVATVHNVEVMVSWNLKHIVNYNRIRMYNEVNRRLGWAAIDIRTPLEVIIDDEPNERV
jgi:hypothetical protein